MLIFSTNKFQGSVAAHLAARLRLNDNFYFKRKNYWLYKFQTYFLNNSNLEYGKNLIKK